MEQLDFLKSLAPQSTNQLDVIPTLFSFVMCIAMSFVLREFYVRRSFSLTGKNHIASVLPILTAVVFLVIIVVKSSLALSLGLVGALSIVRFRTPIKEPEELVYLFLAIAIGLGYAAGQLLITTVIVFAILIVAYLWLSNRNSNETSEYTIVINWTSSKLSFETIAENMSHAATSLKLVRLDRAPKMNSAVMLFTPKPDAKLDDISESLSEIEPSLSMSFFEAKTNW
jgi:hypothetical protein